MDPWALVVTYSGTFLGGVAVGAAGEYYAVKFTDQRRAKEQAKKADRTFKETRAMMPDLIEAMNKALREPGNELVREFYLLPRGARVGGTDRKRLVYYDNEVPDLREKIAILEKFGYVENITVKNTPLFQMTEDFARRVKEI